MVRFGIQITSIDSSVEDEEGWEDVADRAVYQNPVSFYSWAYSWTTFLSLS